MIYIAPLFLIIVLMLAVYLGIVIFNLGFLFGVIIPYLAFLIFILGFIYRILAWAKLPVPYRIPTTSGQAKSLDWIKQDKLESPSTLKDVIARMALEVLFFRSLFRNTKAELRPGPLLTYTSSKWLWLGAMVFHWALLIIVIRHYRFFLEPVPFLIGLLEQLDGFFQITLPTFYLTNLLVLAALAYLIGRRFFSPLIRYISLSQDYFPLYLISAIVITGILMRYGLKTDVTKIKAHVQSLVHFQFISQSGIGPLFYIHLFLVSLLGVYFPFSKLMHMGGVFLSPTRNLANNTREKRHINPVNPIVAIHPYSDYEDEFREKMIKSGIPLDQE